LFESPGSPPRSMYAFRPLTEGKRPLMKYGIPKSQEDRLGESAKSARVVKGSRCRNKK
jgi:hypothetical protein